MPHHHHLTEPQWVDRFLDRLGTLRPSVHAAGSRERALQAYAEAADNGPEEAAERYVLELPSPDAGAAGET
ncbi:MAG TPA: hypothetical protein VGM74_08875 [Burkholderiaceae bacterium]|jgi:hypothetical protein